VTDAILVRGIAADGRHGLRATGERDRPQPFVVDVELRGDLQSAAEADSLDATVDYVELASTVRYVIEVESFELVESLAVAIAAAVLELGGDTVRVRVTKPRSAELINVAEVAVVVERESD
jgi:dihydroneopterin aldolase